MLVLALVLALHAAAWWLVHLRSPAVRQAQPDVPARVSLRWLPPTREPVREAAPAPRAVAPRPTVRPALRTPRAVAAPTLPPTPGPTTPAARQAVAVAAPPAAASAASSAGTGTGGTPLRELLDSAATRQAIAEAARAPSLADLPGTTTRAGPTQQLGTAIAAGARGDCDKGDYAGGGMGLLSLPFWAVAKLRGNCAK